MTDKTYTIEELNQASKELGGAQDVYFGRLTKQADKNRIVKEGLNLVTDGMPRNTAADIAMSAQRLFDELGRRHDFQHVKWDMIKTAMPALVTAAGETAKQGTGFTEEQVRRAVTVRAVTGGYSDAGRREFADAVIQALREPETVTEPAEGGVYKSPAGVLYRRNNGFWERFGTSMVLNDDELNYPVSEMERVL